MHMPVPSSSLSFLWHLANSLSQFFFVSLISISSLLPLCFVYTFFPRPLANPCLQACLLYWMMSSSSVVFMASSSFRFAFTKGWCFITAFKKSPSLKDCQKQPIPLRMVWAISYWCSQIVTSPGLILFLTDKYSSNLEWDLGMGWEKSIYWVFHFLT